MKKFSAIAFFTLALLSGAPRADTSIATPPDEIVHKTTDDMLAIIKANRSAYVQDHTKLYKMAEEKVLPHFDFARMSQWVLGLHWRQATPEQRGHFVAQFRDLLVRTYSTALLNYTSQQVVYYPLTIKPADKEVLVKTEIKQSGGAPSIPINYSFYKNKDDAWKVYDVTIDGVSLVANYRSVYAAKVREQGMDGLLASMADSAKAARK